MQNQCLVALYPSRDIAEQAHQALLASGIAEDHIRLSDTDGPGSQAAMDRSMATETRSGSAWEWLFGSDVPEHHQQAYRTGLSEGRIAVSVLVEDASPMPSRSDVEDILERSGPIDLHAEDATDSTAPAAAARTDSGEERTIPLPEEQLEVGKRATETVLHVRTYVVEEPVQQDVTLHDERTIIERRAATGATAGEPAEREFEIRERREEPVVEKRAGAGEELVIRKEAEDRTERVSDTVRKTKVEIEGEQK
jgi:stress response protein YsnF